MAVPRGRGLRPGSVVRALLRLVLLVGVGFAAGLLIGVLSEEPELLAGHLRGESESVALEARDSEAAERSAQDDSSRPVDLEPSGEAREGDPEPAFRLPGEAIAAPKRAPERPRDTELERPETLRRPAVAAARNLGEGERPAFGPSSVVAVSSRSERAWAIQVGAFSDEATAAQLAAGLDEKGYPVELVPANGKQRRWRVRVQPLPGEAEAKTMADRLKRDERLPTWVLPMEARSDS